MAEPEQSPSLSPVTRDAALAAIARQQAIWDDLVARVGPDRIDLSGAMGDWTFKDLADHVTVWEQHELARLAAATNGEPAPAPIWPPTLTEDDEINVWIQARTATRAGVTVLTEAHDGFDDLAALVRAMPESHLNSTASIPWAGGFALGPALVSGDWFYHNAEHVAAAEVWLANLPPTTGRGQ